MTAQEMIKKFKLELAERDGIKGFKMNVKPTLLQIEELKAAKPEIMIELEKIETERKAINIAKQLEREANSALLRAEYIATKNLQRCLIKYDDWDNMTVKWSIQTLDITPERAFQPNYNINECISLQEITPKMELFQAIKFDKEYGMGGIVWEITPEQELQIIEEQKIAVIEAKKISDIKNIESEKIAINKKAEKEAKIKAIYESARLTNEKQLLSKWSDDCDDPREQCDIDIVYEYAMPNGTVKIERHHTW